MASKVARFNGEGHQSDQMDPSPGRSAGRLASQTALHKVTQCSERLTRDPRQATLARAENVLCIQTGAPKGRGDHSIPSSFLSGGMGLLDAKEMKCQQTG